MLLNNNNRVVPVHRWASIVAATGLVLAGGHAFAASSRPAIAVSPEIVRTPTCKGEVGTPQRVELAAGKSRFLRLSERVTRLTLGNDKIVDAKLISPTALYLVGAGVGSTNMILQGSHGCTVFDVIVQVDPALLKATLHDVMPDEDIDVRTAGDSIVLSGNASSAVAAERIESLARSYLVRSARNLDAVGGGSSGPGTSISFNSGNNRTSANTLLVNMMTVAAPQQVMLEVKVAEVSKTVLDRFGINFSRAFALGDGSAVKFLNGLLGGQGLITGQISGTTDAHVGGGAVNSTGNGTAFTGTTAPIGSATTDGSTIPLAAGRNATTIGVDAQKQDGLVKVLAEPTVMAISGQEGSFLAGGKIFIPVTQANASGGITYTLEEKEFGVSLRFRPTVLADGRINLEVNPEVSELSSTGVTIASTASGSTVLPAFSTRKASTTVQLFDGQSFAIGGLMKNNATTNISAFPILGELPVIGALFRSTSFQTDRSELVFVITPRLVKPLPADYALPTDSYVEPTRADVILRGKLEGTRKEAEDAAPAASGGFDVK